jgi:hypothetical protein
VKLKAVMIVMSLVVCALNVAVSSDVSQAAVSAAWGVTAGIWLMRFIQEDKQ